MSEEPEGADEVRCALCDGRIVDSAIPADTTFVNYYVPATGFRKRLFLCGEHGIEFRAEYGGAR